MSINKKTNQRLNQEDIIATDDTQIVYAGKNSWQLLDTKDIQDDETKDIEAALPTTTDVSQPANDLSETRSRASYAFGIKNVVPGYRSYNLTSGIVSAEIPVENTRYIELAADVTENDASSVEFSILDGNTEQPILPGSIRTVRREKLFYNLKPRFDIDTSHTVTIQEDGKDVGSSYADFDQEKLRNTNHVYTISYTPLNAWRVTVEHTVVKLKAVVRVYANGYPPRIEHIAVQKGGGTLQWQI